MATARVQRDRRALVGIGAQFFINGAMTASFLARLPELRTQIDVGLAAFGLLLTLAATAGIVGSTLAGRFIERWQSRVVLTAGSLLMAAALIIIGRAHTPLVAFAGLWLYGICDVLVDIAMNLQASWVSARRRVPVMNRLHGLWALGALTGGAVAARAAAADVSLGRQLTLTAVVLATVIVAIRQLVLATDEAGHEDARGRVASPRRPARQLLGAIALGGCSAVLVESVPADWSVFRMSIDFGLPPGRASWAFVALAGGLTSARFVGDWFEHRLGRSRSGRVASVVTIVGLLLATATTSSTATLVGFALSGAGVATALPRLYDDAARLPGRRGAGLGVLAGAMRVCGLTAPVLVAALASTTLGVGAAIAIVTVPAAFIYLVISDYLAHRFGIRRPWVSTG